MKPGIIGALLGHLITEQARWAKVVKESGEKFE
jgi:hypothetical protein